MARFLLLLLLVFVFSCAKPAQESVIPQPLRPPKPDIEHQPDELSAQAQGPAPVTRVYDAPTPPQSGGGSVPPEQLARPVEPADGISVALDNLPLALFINEVYGNLLRRTFELAPELAKQQDLVTFRSGRKLAPQELDAIARDLLKNYGVNTRVIGERLRFELSSDQVFEQDTPIVISGRALPTVPMTHRPVYYVAPLRVVSPAEMQVWLTDAYKGQNIKIEKDEARNLVRLLGSANLVSQVMQAIEMLDKPTFMGKFSQRIEPVYLTPTELAEMLVSIMSTEGYAASICTEGQQKTPLCFLPFDSINSLIYFAADRQIGSHVVNWTRSLDQPEHALGLTQQNSVQYYKILNTNAQDIYDVLQELVGALPTGADVALSIADTGTGRNAPAGGAVANMAATRDLSTPAALSTGDTVTPRQGAARRATQSTGSTDAAGNSLVVDKARNAIIFHGNTKMWNVLLPIIREMDKAPRMVLIEVTVAELTFKDDEELGVEWLLKAHNITGTQPQSTGFFQFGGSSLVPIDNFSKGFTFVLDQAGETRAVLNAFAEKKRVTILSTPRIMVKSGSQATIDVGTDIPTLSRQTQSTSSQDRVINEIEYRKTGVLLSVTPVVHSGNRIELKISQEVSQQIESTDVDIPSPSIFTRKIETELGLRDGGSVLLGGLISDNKTKGYTGVPILSDIPLLGRAFRNESEKNDRTQLIMLIIPYIIDNDQEAVAITETLKESLIGIGR